MTTAAAPLPGPEEYDYNADLLLIQTPGPDTSAADEGRPWTWTPMWHRAINFDPDAFDDVMQNLMRNPNVLSSWLFRADIVAQSTDEAAKLPTAPPVHPFFGGIERADDRTIVRRLIPRNTMRDKPMLQTCMFYESREEDDDAVQRSLVVYLPHETDPALVPFYHPKVQGVGFLHEWRPLAGTGTVSIHFSFFPPSSPSSSPTGSPAQQPRDAELEKKLSRPILSRVALSLINTVCKHGLGKKRGYVKRVHHDQLVPQARVQDRYTRLKETHARRLVETWQETTDPAKHVFEDLSIAAFLMELWADMYGGEDGVPAAFPGFVDVGCGNGLLVHILNAEGYAGWGFDARKRRSWEQYGNAGKEAEVAQGARLPLQESLLLPSFLVAADADADAEPEPEPKRARLTATGLPVHDGTFPPGSFLIANHADELTVWTPLLAALSGCAFIAIPCCSHNFTGAKFRAPPPSSAAKEATASVSVTLASSSTYASFVEWVVSVAEACGWKVEFEMLRIPSTRNVGLVGRTGRQGRGLARLSLAQAWDVIDQFGGAHGFADNVAKLAAETKKSSH